LVKSTLASIGKARTKASDNTRVSGRDSAEFFVAILLIVGGIRCCRHRHGPLRRRRGIFVATGQEAEGLQREPAVVEQRRRGEVDRRQQSRPNPTAPTSFGRCRQISRRRSRSASSVSDNDPQPEQPADTEEAVRVRVGASRTRARKVRRRRWRRRNRRPSVSHSQNGGFGTAAFRDGD
jgi:hypothetical protein